MILSRSIPSKVGGIQTRTKSNPAKTIQNDPVARICTQGVFNTTRTITYSFFSKNVGHLQSPSPSLGEFNRLELLAMCDLPAGR